MPAPAATKYSWSTVPLEQLNPALSRRIVTGKEVMVAHVHLKAGCVVPKHHHVNEQVTYILQGAMRLWVGDKVDSQSDADGIVLATGELLVIPSNVPHRAVALEDTLDMDVFAPPREDWLNGTDDYLRQKVASRAKARPTAEVTWIMDSQYSALVGRLEREADAHPQLYLGKVAVAAALGYLVPGLIALGILTCCFSILYALVTGGTPSILASIGILAGAAALIPTIRALRVQVAVPDGLLLTPEDAPDLFRLIDVISRKIVAVPFATVKINGDFKLGIQQIPRWGVFGGYSNHLYVGAPLLLALSADEFCALLAHEIAHLGGGQRRFGAWIYRVREDLAPVGRASSPSRPTHSIARSRIYYRWYAPWFYAYSFASARTHEYESDHLAAYVTSAQTLGRALIQVELASRFLSDIYWARFLGPRRRGARAAV